MAKSQRLLRSAGSLSKSIEQMKGCGFDWSEDRLIENLGKELTQLIPEIGSKRVELLTDGMKNEWATVERGKGGHPDEDGKSWLNGAPED
eukprot:596516-Pyramimonas_sp.AAC.1